MLSATYSTAESPITKLNSKKEDREGLQRD
jgi:hypothetical protein